MTDLPIPVISDAHYDRDNNRVVITVEPCAADYVAVWRTLDETQPVMVWSRHVEPCDVRQTFFDYTCADRRRPRKGGVGYHIALIGAHVRVCRVLGCGVQRAPLTCVAGRCGDTARTPMTDPSAYLAAALDELESLANEASNEGPWFPNAEADQVMCCRFEEDADCDHEYCDVLGDGFSLSNRVLRGNVRLICANDPAHTLRMVASHRKILGRSQDWDEASRIGPGSTFQPGRPRGVGVAALDGPNAG